MKKFPKSFLAILFLLSLPYQKTYPQVALKNIIQNICTSITENSWYCLESDEALITRIETEYFALYSQYRPTIDYFLISQTGLIAQYGQPREKIFIDSQKVNEISETALHNFALYIGTENQSIFGYDRDIILAKKKLAQCQDDLMRRIDIRTAKHRSYEQQKNVHMMRTLLRDISILSNYIIILDQCFEAHEIYFYVYQTMKEIRFRYDSYLILLENHPNQIIEDIRYQAHKHSLIRFVKNLVMDIETLQRDTVSFSRNHVYDTAQKDITQLLNQLMSMKNTLVSNDIYWQELVKYQIEVERRIKELEKELHKERMRAPTVVYQRVYYPAPGRNTVWGRAY